MNHFLDGDNNSQAMIKLRLKASLTIGDLRWLRDISCEQ
jgi:hypothetical protein